MAYFCVLHSPNYFLIWFKSWRSPFSLLYSLPKGQHTTLDHPGSTKHKCLYVQHTNSWNPALLFRQKHKLLKRMTGQTKSKMTKGKAAAMKISWCPPAPTQKSFLYSNTSRQNKCRKGGKKSSKSELKAQKFTRSFFKVWGYPHIALKYLLQKEAVFVSRLQTDLELPSPKPLGDCSRFLKQR